MKCTLRLRSAKPPESHGSRSRFHSRFEPKRATRNIATEKASASTRLSRLSTAVFQTAERFLGHVIHPGQSVFEFRKCTERANSLGGFSSNSSFSAPRGRNITRHLFS